MKQAKIKKQDLTKALDSLRGEYRVIAPVQDNKTVNLKELPAGAAPLLVYTNFPLSAKWVFFPQSEVICTFKNDEVQDVPVPDARQLVFGIRPCDARSYLMLDKVFGEFGKGPDPYYMKRRENGTVVTLSCSEPCATCFCTSIGGHPGGKDGSDATLFDNGDDVILEAVTAKGEALLDQLSAFSQQPSADEITHRDRVLQEAAANMPVVSLDQLKEKLQQSFSDTLWDELSKVCLGCGMCSFECPTCHCFDISDEEKGGEGRRIRSWDSCQFSLFTMHASGHNPRTAKLQRMRQRILHKFLYTVENFGDVFCVGCGRCISNCPVNQDLREVLTRFAEKEV